MPFERSDSVRNVACIDAVHKDLHPPPKAIRTKLWLEQMQSNMDSNVDSKSRFSSHTKSDLNTNAGGEMS